MLKGAWSTSWNKAAELSKSEIIPLQFLRGLAASFVLLIHLLSRLELRGVFPGGLPIWLGSLGVLGVQMFFAISGFIMIHTTRREFEHRLGSAHFLRRRMIRVLPLYYATSLLIVPFQYLTLRYSTNASYSLPSLDDVVRSALFLPYLRPDGLLQPIYGLGWTLNCEMFFYLLIAIAIRIGRPIGIGLVIAAISALCLAGLPLQLPTQHTSWPAVLLYFYSRPIMMFFVLGIVVALLNGIIKAPIRINQALLCLATGLILFLSGPYGPWAAAAGVAIAMVAATMLWNPGSNAGLFNKVAKAFGDASYSMYLTHSFILGAFALAVTRIVDVRGPALIAVLLAAVLICFSIGWLSWRCFEVPVTSLLRGRRPQAASAKDVAP